MRRRFAAVMLALFMLAGSAALAEPLGPHGEITGFTGYTYFDRDRNELSTTDLRDIIHFGGRLGLSLTRHFTLEGGVGFTPTQEDTVNGRNMNFPQYSGEALWTPTRLGNCRPYLLIGGAVSRLDLTSGTRSSTQGNVMLGAGAQFWLNDAVGLRGEASDLMWLPKDRKEVKSHVLQLTVGLTFAFLGKPRDTDGDGIPDTRDQCPKTLLGARVDARGCPIDTDKDGVPDGLDACTATPAGCKVNGRGCPADADSDGVCDGLDLCANTPRGARVTPDGCPTDSDHDGVPDGIDQCDSTAVGCKADARGCTTDTDGDGVCDGLDKCPDTPLGVTVDRDGCPVVHHHRAPADTTGAHSSVQPHSGAPQPKGQPHTPPPAGHP